MSDTLRYGIIGCGMMGREHLRNLALIPGTVVTAIAEPDPEQRALNAAAAPGAVMLEDHRALLARDDVDALVIASPNFTHKSILDDVLAARPRPVLVEKPVVTTLEDCAKLEAAAAAWSQPLWVAMEYRYMPPVAELLREARSGSAGALRMLTIREHRFPFLEKVGDWNRFNSRTGGTLVEKCCHFFDLMRLILGSEPVRVFASGGADVNHRDERYDGETPDILDNAYVIVDFASGARAMLELAMFAEGAPWQEEITLVGERARLAAYVPGPARFRPEEGHRPAEMEICPRAPFGPLRWPVHVDEKLLDAGDHHGSTYYQHLGFRKAALGLSGVDVTLADGIAAVRIGAAAERSAATGAPVAL